MARFDVEGLQKLLDELGRIGTAGERIEKTVLLKAGERVKEAIIKEAPERTGYLKKNIKLSNIKREDGASFVEVYPSKDAFYAAFLEYGTSKINADPFISRGYESSKDEAEELIIEEIRKELGL